MRRKLHVLLTLAALLVVALAGPAMAQDEVTAADRAAIRTVIEAQLEAFRRDDAAAAFSFAAPGIQARFGDGAHFVAIVREAYPAVIRPRSVSFDRLERDDGLLVQRVELVGADGAPALALYSMEHEHDGRWLIAGCSLRHSGRIEI